MDKEDIFYIFDHLSIRAEVEPIIVPIGDRETTYGERRVGNKITVQLLFDGEDLISEDTVEVIS